MTVRYETLDRVESRQEAIACLVQGSVNGTLFHQPRFLSYHDPEALKRRGVEDLSVAFYKGQSLIGFVPGGTRLEGRQSVYLSPYGSAYGGLVFRKGLSLENLRRMVDSFLGFLLDRDYRQARIVLPLRCFHAEPYYDTVKFLLMQQGFAVTASDLKMVVDLKRGDVSEQFHHSARKFLRQALEKGVQVCPSRDVMGFFRNASDYYRSRGIPVTHTPEEMDRLAGVVPEDLFLFEAVVGGRRLGGLLLIRVNENALYAMYVYLEEEAYGLRAINAVYAHVLKWMAGRGYRFLDLGTSGDGQDISRDLLHFKETIGGWGVLRETLTWERKP